jgi:DNA-binding CsgD family transcriptional regulator
MSNDVRERRSNVGMLVLFLLIFALIGGDLVSDYGAGTSLWHLAAEFAVLVAAGIGIVSLWLRLKAARRSVRALERDVEAAKRQAEQWRSEARELLAGLAAAIDRQFARWTLTAAEKEIAMLLLQGLGHKQIAGRRDTSERTVREQARSVYHKAGLQGRSELAAFFLGGLLQAQQQEPPTLPTQASAAQREGRGT